MEIKQAVIIAGGLGTRLRPFTETNPKPMYPFEGKPFIEHLVLQIKEWGIKDILILLGYLPEKVMDYLGDGSRLGVNITYDVTPVEYETGQRMRHALAQMQETFLFMYCDNYCPIDFHRLVDDYEKNGAEIQITAYANRDQYTKNNLRIADTGLVEVYDKKRTTPGLAGVDIGYAIINRKVIEAVPDESVNFEAYSYPQLVEQKKLYATICEHRYYSVGSWERIELTKQFFQNQKAIFLDRDGTINVRPPKACYVESAEEFQWLPQAREAIKKIRDHGYLVILVSNQPGIARGRLTEETLHEIHEKMQKDLREIGTQIDDIFYCPHNWDEGCFCRKPNPGMIYAAQQKYSLNLNNCCLIGDDERDIEAANRAGIRSYMVTENYAIMDAVDELIGGQI